MNRIRKTKGLHIIVDLYGCDPHQINSVAFWKKTFAEAAASAHMEVLHEHFHQFEPQGMTGFLLLATSHISVHTWPEYGYAACDVFSCSDDVETNKAAEHVMKSVEYTRKSVQKIKRGYTIMTYLESPIYRTGKTVRTRVIKKLAEVNSAFQNIVVADLKKFGKSLIIDGLVQTSEFDHETYDKALLSPLSPHDKHILILGGGDGYVAQMALKMNPKLKITIIDLDVEVVDLAKKQLGQEIFSHPNVQLNIGDATTYLKTYYERQGELMDGIVLDLTDNPIGGKGAEAKLRHFYKEVFALSKQILKPGGWMSAQAGVAKVIPKYVDTVSMMQTLAKQTFGNFERKDVMIPSFSDKNSFIWAKN
jgi:spermidine synthase